MRNGRRGAKPIRKPYKKRAQMRRRMRGSVGLTRRQNKKQITAMVLEKTNLKVFSRLFFPKIRGRVSAADKTATTNHAKADLE